MSKIYENKTSTHDTQSNTMTEKQMKPYKTYCHSNITRIQFNFSWICIVLNDFCVLYFHHFQIGVCCCLIRYSVTSKRTEINGATKQKCIFFSIRFQYGSFERFKFIIRFRPVFGTESKKKKKRKQMMLSNKCFFFPAFGNHYCFRSIRKKKPSTRIWSIRHMRRHEMTANQIGFSIPYLYDLECVEKRSKSSQTKIYHIWIMCEWNHITPLSSTPYLITDRTLAGHILYTISDLTS